jgi:2-iminobutanoate/2-iminopropanoate deaminase
VKFISAKDVYKPIGPYSSGVSAGNMAFVSGLGGLESDGKVASMDVEQQTRRALENCKKVLEADGFTLKDVAKVCVYLLDISNYEKMNAVYAEFMGDHRPARICMAVNELPANEVVKFDMTAVKE